MCQVVLPGLEERAVTAIVAVAILPETVTAIVSAVTLPDGVTSKLRTHHEASGA